MKIAVGTDDSETIHNGPFCGSKYFKVFEILNAEVVDSLLRDNLVVTGEMIIQGHVKAGEVLRLLKDCSLFMGRSFGKEAVDDISSHGIDCISTPIHGIEDAVDSYLDGKLENFSYYSPNLKVHRPCLRRPYT